MPYKDEEKQREYQRKWTKRNREIQRQYMRKIRAEAIEHLGGKCEYCGCDIPEALEVNHINGTKNIHKRHKSSSKSFNLAILRGEYDDKVELTCRVCNAVHYLQDLLKIKGKWTVMFRA